MSERGLETVNIFNDIISLLIKSIEKDGVKMDIYGSREILIIHLDYVE